MLNQLTDIEGVAVGHASDLGLGSGVTAVLFNRPAVAAVAVLGGAPGGRDTGMLEPEMSIERVDALVLSGGSTYGLDAAGGVVAMLRAAGRGYAIRNVRVPIVPQAIIFDLLNGGNKDWGVFSPYRDLGYAAAMDARPGAFALGTVGGGTGATTATLKGGIGSASVRLASGHVVAALVVVNAVGAPTIGVGRHFWAAPFERDGEFGGLGWPVAITPQDLALRTKGMAGTTIGIVATDAELTRPQAKRLAIMAHDGLARAVMPAHAPMDGDTMFAAATGTRGPADLTALGHAATQVTARAIARGVFEATALPYPGAQRSWRESSTRPA